MAASSLTLPVPDDWHVHLREGTLLKGVLRFTAERFGRAMVMPNLQRPLTTVSLGRAYLEAIHDALPEKSDFRPLLACYLTDETSPEELLEGVERGVFQAAKWYPAHTTTNSQLGVSDYRVLCPLLERMQRWEMPLLIHAEVSDLEVDIFDREKVFVDKVLGGLLVDFPELPVVVEHVSTAEAVAFVCEHSPRHRLGATITAHHLWLNRNDLLAHGLQPHHYCRPVLQRESDRQALIKAATAGLGPFFLGTDSAPHVISDKECASGAAGVFSAPTALELYAQLFDQVGALRQLEAFACHNGAQFYRLPQNPGTITLERAELQPPERILFDNGSQVRPWWRPVNWRIASRSRNIATHFSTAHCAHSDNALAESDERSGRRVSLRYWDLIRRWS